MGEIMIKDSEKAVVKVAEQFIKLDPSDKAYILGVMAGMLLKSNSEQTKSA